MAVKESALSALKDREEMEDVAANPNKEMKILPVDFEPGPNDVICARGNHASNHSGYLRYRQYVDDHLEAYTRAHTKLDKSLIVSKVRNLVLEASPDAGFVKKIQGRWYVVNEGYAREKIGQTFRDALHFKYRSSNKAKKIRYKEAAVFEDAAKEGETTERSRFAAEGLKNEHKSGDRASVPGPESNDDESSATAADGKIGASQLDSATKDRKISLQPSAASIHTSPRHGTAEIGEHLSPFMPLPPSQSTGQSLQQYALLDMVQSYGRQDLGRPSYLQDLQRHGLASSLLPNSSLAPLSTADLATLQRLEVMNTATSLLQEQRLLAAVQRDIASRGTLQVGNVLSGLAGLGEAAVPTELGVRGPPAVQETGISLQQRQATARNTALARTLDSLGLNYQSQETASLYETGPLPTLGQDSSVLTGDGQQASTDRDHRNPERESSSREASNIRLILLASAQVIGDHSVSIPIGVFRELLRHLESSQVEDATHEGDE